MSRRRSAFSWPSVMASAIASGGGTLRNSICFPALRITPSVYFGGSLRADSTIRRCSLVRVLKRAICSTSAFSIVSRIHHSHIDSTRLIEPGKSSMFCVASQNQICNLRHIFVPLAIFGPSSGFVVMMWPSSVRNTVWRPSCWVASPMDWTWSINPV